MVGVKVSLCIRGKSERHDTSIIKTVISLIKLYFLHPIPSVCHQCRLYLLHLIPSVCHAVPFIITAPRTVYLSPVSFIITAPRTVYLSTVPFTCMRTPGLELSRPTINCSVGYEYHFPRPYSPLHSYSFPRNNTPSRQDHGYFYDQWTRKCTMMTEANCNNDYYRYDQQSSAN